MFFPDMNCTEWEYDKDKPYIKRRNDDKKFRCIYDGHIITSWYAPCPKKLEESLKKCEEYDYD